MPPIFFAWTRSFWFGVLSVLAAVGAMSPDQVRPLVMAFASIWSDDPRVAADVAVSLLPMLSAVSTTFALHQRSGNARPYTLRLSADTLA